MFRSAPATAYSARPVEEDVVPHEWVYMADGLRQTELVRSFLEWWQGDVLLHPPIEWHRKHRSARVQGTDIFLLQAEPLEYMRVPIHGPAPHEDWLAAGAPVWVVRWRGQFYVLRREQLQSCCHPLESCVFQSQARYLHIPADSPLLSQTVPRLQ
jgi:hypothetical protein